MNTSTSPGYALAGTTSLPFAEAVALVRTRLADEGFGIVAEIDVASTLREKLGVDREPYLILGACNPTAAHRALEVEPDLGTLLPCNVVVSQVDGETHVTAVDPAAMLGLVGNPELDPIGVEIRERIERAVSSVWAE